MTQLDTEQARQITTPIYLITLYFRTITFRYSTRQTCTWNGNQYRGGMGFQVLSITQRDAGAMTAEIELSNHNRAMSAIVLNEGTNRARAKIHKGYGTGDTLAIDAVMPRFDGVIEGAPFIGDTIRLTLITENILTQFSPRTLCGPPVFNHIPPSGTILTWGGEQYELTRQ